MVGKDTDTALIYVNIPNISKQKSNHVSYSLQLYGL